MFLEQQLPVWALGRCIANQEFATRAALAAINPPVIAYCPERVVLKKVSRHCRRRVEIRSPAFATYLMVLIPTPVHWHAAFNSGYFRVRPVSHSDRVITVRESVIEELRALEAEGAFNDKEPPVTLGWRAGEVILIATGGVEMSARIARDTGAGSKMVPVEFLPSGLTGRVPNHLIQRADP